MQICLLCQFFITLLPNFRNPYTHIPHKQKDSARPFGRVESMSSRFYTSRAEVSVHYNKIRYIQHADEHADPALELTAHERRDHGCGTDDEAGRNIQQHAPDFQRPGGLPCKSAHSGIISVRSMIFAPMILPTDSEDCFFRIAVMVVTSSGSEVPIAIMVAAITESGTPIMTASAEPLSISSCAEDDGGSAEDELADVYRNALAVGARALVGRLASLLALCGKDALDHKADEKRA